MSATCLIGEADPFIARLLVRFGEESGFEVVQARSGDELMDLACRLRPDVIVLEAELPGRIWGWEAIRAIKADPELSAIPVITCSWLPQPDAQALTGAVAAHLQKPELHYCSFVDALLNAGLGPGGRPSRRLSGHP